MTLFHKHTSKFKSKDQDVILYIKMCHRIVGDVFCNISAQVHVTSSLIYIHSCPSTSDTNNFYADNFL